MLTSIIFLALTGFAISLYTYLTEKKLQKDPNYKPACDISDTISCSKPIKSKYGKLFYISNSIVGMLFYTGIAILAFFDARIALFVASLGSVLASVFLAYILYFKIKSLCVLCTALYVVNALLLLTSIRLAFFV